MVKITGSGFHDGPVVVTRSPCRISLPQMIQAHGSYVGAEGSRSVSAAIAKHAATGHQSPVRGTTGTKARGRGSRNIDRAAYPFQLRPNDGWNTLHASYAVTGVGDTPNPVREHYQVQQNVTYEYTLMLRPLTAEEARAGLPAGA